MKKRHYTPQEKAHALRTIQENDGDMAQASLILNIPARTLYDWRRKHENLALQKKFVPPPPQYLQNPQNPQLPPIEQSAFGMTREELAKALEIEYIPSPFNTLRQAFLEHLNALQPSLSEDPDSAHVRALAVTSLLDNIIRLEELCRLEKPQLNIFKYEYKDGTFHDIPEWNNKVYERADQAYYATLRKARREYYALKGEVYDESPFATASNQAYSSVEEPTLEELAAMPFTAEDFNPEPTGIFAWAKHRSFRAPFAQSDNDSHFDED